MGKGSGATGYMKGGDALTVANQTIPHHHVTSTDKNCRPLSPERWQTRFRPKGLTNVGNTCYANAVLQCLLSTALTQALMDPTAISVFRQYSFNLKLLRQGSGSVDSEDENDDGNNLKSSSSSDALQKKKNKINGTPRRKTRKPDMEMKDKCAWLTQELKKVTAQYVSITSQHDMDPPSLTDSFSSFFVPPRAPEINPQSITRYPHRISKCLRPYQQEDAHEFLRALLETLAMNGRNKELSSLFDGLMESSITCQSCGKPSLTRDRYMDLSLDIADDHIETLPDALKQFTQSEILSGDNKVFCSRCEKKCFATKALRLATAPSILVCHLKRFAFNKLGGLTRLSKKVKFPQHLEIADYMSNLNQSRPPSFELVAVLVHQGQSCEAGHYVAFVKSEGEWFCCNDREVHRVPVEKVMNQQAYILMYEVAEMRENHGFPSPSGSPVHVNHQIKQEPGKPPRVRNEPSLLNHLFCALEDTAIQSMCCVLTNANRSGVIQPVSHTPPRRARDDGEVGRQRSRDSSDYDQSVKADDFRKSTSSVNLEDLGKRKVRAKSSSSSRSATRRMSRTDNQDRSRRLSGADRDLRPPRPKSYTPSHRRAPSLDRARRPPPLPPTTKAASGRYPPPSSTVQ